jgi:hypothetical protein
MPNAEPGTVHMFTYEAPSWVRKTMLWRSGGNPWDPDAFGAAVGISGETVVAGAPQYDRDGIDAGAGLVFANWACLPGNGDMNCDGATNGADIDVFFVALVNPSLYRQQFPNCSVLRGDINADGVLNGADIDLFFLCLSTTGCP